ncbi:MAG TPA: heme-binding domain-containing protein [Bacteroidales bacterium]|nr:heme-binding domain-containing protein [Bacteroidales bacterium]
MRKSVSSSFAAFLVLATLGLFLPFSIASAQNATYDFPALPDSINKIVTRSCMPCHSNDGGMMSRSKLNFSAWADYSKDQQSEKAQAMQRELSEGKMPPKRFREARPELIPNAKQVDTIKKWAEALGIPQQ